MSQISHIRHIMSDLLSRDNIAYRAELKAVLDAISVFPATSIGLHVVAEHLLSIPEIFAYIISVWDRSDDMISQIISDFPTSSQEYPSSLANKMLDALSMYFLGFPLESLALDVSRNISRHKKYVEAALPLFCALNTMTFTSEQPFESNADLLAVGPDDGLIKPKVPQKIRKRNRQKPRVTIDVSLFDKLDVPVPRKGEEATLWSISILKELKDILSFYLSLLRKTELAGDIKALLLPRVEESGKDVAPDVPSTEGVDNPTKQPDTYPMIQPMKVALYFDNADKFGEWRILISTEAGRNLREFRKADRKIFKMIFEKIKQLSHGHFSHDNHKRLNRPDAGIPIHEAKITRDLRLVYQVDCVPDHDGQFERQVIKVYGIYTYTQLGRIWDALGSHLALKGREYRRRCILRNKPALSKNNMILPASFPPTEYEPECIGAQLDLSDKDMDHLHSLLVLEKYVTFSQAFLHSLIAKEDVQHVFELTTRERKIVECDTSCYVLGRSGTGKTTTMLFKILGIQRAWEMSNIDMPKPRQIFVTKSRVLAMKVEEYFTKLLESLALARYTLQELAKMKSRRVWDDLIDVNDTPESQMNVPMRYSKLEDKHFPLFITFDRLAKMIAADIFSKDNPETKYGAGMFFAADDAETLHDSFVTYEVFANQYWPHFPQGLTKNLNPWLVFSEFMGIIKGSEHALSCSEGVLDRRNYFRLPSRSNPNFANNREVLYDIFEVYTKLKRQRRHHDVADRTQAIIKVLRNQNFPSQKIDYMYVDEAQDNLLIDAFILRRLCRNPNGLFWAGDTAQTISAGSSFRFDDLKAFIYRIEDQSASADSAGVSLRQPTMFQLAINYRSHGGIVNCAHSVVELITRFWPNTIDRLRQEKGVVDGLKPIFFTGWDKDAVQYEQFLFGASGSHIEFGAEQCILVRNEVARDKLRKQIGDAGVIMTIYESKGLEFNDVLLYNFFEDSVVDLSRWRIVLNGVEGERHAPNFERDEARFAGVCSELKLLYVGITRARKNMWIVDKSDKSDPMRIFWTSRNQVQNCTPGTDVPHLAVSSTPEQWEAFGRSLFSHKHYVQASHCFERAGLRREVKVCEAYRLREMARSGVGVGLLNDQKRAFIVAADTFADCGADTTGNEKYQYYRNAAYCYIKGGEDIKAADAYIKAEEFELAAKGYRKAGRFDRTLHVLDNYGSRIPRETTEELRTVCRLFYCSRNTHPPSRLFSSFDEELEFLEDYDLDYARASLLETHSRYYEAAKLHLSENRPLEAVEAFIKDSNNAESTAHAAGAIVEYFWRNCSFRVSAKDALVNEELRHFMKLADQLQTNKMNPLDRDLISMFQSILRNDYRSLDNLGFALTKHGSKTAVLLCLDHIFSQEVDVPSFSVYQMAHFLSKFHTYARLLHQISTFPDPMEHQDILKLFSIVQLPGDEFLIPHKTFLYSSATETRQATNLVSEHASGYKSSRRNITELLRLSVRTVLKDKVLAVNGMCYKSPVFSQCVTFLVTGSCRRECCPQEHIPMVKLDRMYYNARVGIHIWQILILQLMFSSHPRYDRRDIMRGWLSSLYEALNPPFFIQGSLADLDMSLIPLRLDGMKVVKAWIRESFYLLDPYYMRREFSTAFVRITCLSFAFDRSDAPNYIPRAKCIVHARPLNLHRKEDNRYMVEDLLSSYHAASRDSISSGILFILHILDNRIYSNLSVLCDCIEDICSAFVIKYRMDPSFNDLPLHNVVLPCNWLISPHKFTTEKDVRLPLMNKLLDEVAKLVEALRVDVGIEFLWLNQTKLTPIMRNIFISRICRILCLVAQNIRNRFVKERVERIMISLHRKIPPSQWRTANYRKLVDEIVKNQALLPGGGWPVSGGYVRALVAFDENKGVNNLVHLVHKNGHPRVYRVRQILYEKPIEIPTLLSSYALGAQSTLSVMAPVFVPRSEHPKVVKEVVQHDEEIAEPLPEEFEGEEERNGDDVAVNADVEADDSLENEDEAIKSFAPDLDDSLRANGPSGEEENAARKIQKVYRHYARYRSSRAVNAEINAIFTACLRETQSPEWCRDRYSLLFLGPLPHLLVCLERGITRAHTAKATAKNLFNGVSHEKLEELGKQRSEMATLLKKGMKLRKQLEPSSATHRIRDINILIRAVKEVKEFMQSVPASMQDVESEFQMAYKGIVAEKKCKVKEKPERPTLNTADIDDYDYY